MELVNVDFRELEEGVSEQQVVSFLSDYCFLGQLLDESVGSKEENHREN
jgi:hypothetical protein